jgi:hypothetical protein
MHKRLLRNSRCRDLPAPASMAGFAGLCSSSSSISERDRLPGVGDFILSGSIVVSARLSTKELRDVKCCVRQKINEVEHCGWAGIGG